MGSSSYSISDSFNGLTLSKLINKHKKENEHKKEDSIAQTTWSHHPINMPNNTKWGGKENDPPVKILSREDTLGTINCILPELELKTSESDECKTNFVPSNSFFSDDPLDLKEIFLNARKYREEQQRLISKIGPNFKKHKKDVDNNFMQSEGKNVHNQPEEYQSKPCRIAEDSCPHSVLLDMHNIRLIAKKNNLSNDGFNYTNSNDNQNRYSYSSVLKRDMQYQTCNNQTFFNLEIYNTNNSSTEHSINYDYIPSKKTNIVNKQKVGIKYNQEEFEKLLEDNINKILEDDDSLPKELSDINNNDSPEIHNNTDFMEISCIQSVENRDISVLTNDINDILQMSINELNQNSKDNHYISNKSDINTESVDSHKVPKISHYNFYARRHFPLFRNNSNPKTKTHFNYQLNPDYFLLYNLRRQNDPTTFSINIMKNNQIPLNTRLVSSSKLELEALQQYQDSDENIFTNKSFGYSNQENIKN